MSPLLHLNDAHREALEVCMRIPLAEPWTPLNECILRKPHEELAQADAW